MIVATAAVVVVEQRRGSGGGARTCGGGGRGARALMPPRAVCETVDDERERREGLVDVPTLTQAGTNCARLVRALRARQVAQLQPAEATLRLRRARGGRALGTAAAAAATCVA